MREAEMDEHSDGDADEMCSRESLGESVRRRR